ncbi:MAG: XdhC family protein [Ktedonobacteraceae bacterium]|nr:XdhC family protein [Ktedonobacteraceae bacterium]MBV9713495.1 XdhC family protein [Ktedonobacteraceae bacterium]
MNATTIYQEIEAAQHRGERIAIVTVVKAIGAAPCGVGSKMLLHADGRYIGSFAGRVTDGKVVEEGMRAIREGRSYMTHVHLDADQGEAVGSCGATLEVFFEVLRPEPRLIIAGAGYVAQALTRLAIHLDFHTIVIDDRRDLADPQVFADNVQLTFGNIPQTIRELTPDESSWVVIVTRGHSLDKDALQAALESNAAYIGMIGSPGKVRRIFKDLLKGGFSRERLAQVHAPIGLDLGAETPDEIALSIAAEIVMLRKKASGASLNTLHSLLEEEATV